MLLHHSMSTIENTGVAIGVIGGMGLGLLLGNEFSGPNITLIGAGLVLISIVAMIVQSLRVKKK